MSGAKLQFRDAHLLVTEPRMSRSRIRTATKCFGRSGGTTYDVLEDTVWSYWQSLGNYFFSRRRRNLLPASLVAFLSLQFLFLPL